MRHAKKFSATLLAAVAFVVSAAAVPAGLAGSGAAVAVTPTLPKSPPGRVLVLSDNASELLDGNDIGETLDMDHLAYRVQSVLSARGTYAPDIVLLQEVTKEATANVAARLTARTGYTYKVAADALTGTGAWENKTETSTTARSIRDTAIVYNSGSMTPVGTPGASLLTYPKSAVSPNYPTSWLWMRQSTIQLKQNNSGKIYAVYSAHYRPDVMVINDDQYVAAWTNFLKQRVHDVYPGTTPIIGGDLNNHNGAFLTPFTSSANSPGNYNVAQPGGPQSVDVIASTDSVISTNRDSDYKSWSDPGPARPTYFDNVNKFIDCYHLYDHYTNPQGVEVNPGGQGWTDAAKAINGCNQRYYSDHEYVWAVFG